MAITINQLEAITHEMVLKKLTDAVYKSNALLNKMYKEKVSLDGGLKISSPVISGAIDSTTGGWYSGAATLTDSEKDDITRVEIDWKQIYETVLIAKSDILKNSGAMQQLQLVASKVKIAEMRMKSRLVNGVFSDGSDSAVFNGLQEIVSDSASYGGLAVGDILDEAGDNGWSAYVNDNSAVDRALSLFLIQKTQGEITESEDKPSVGVSRQNVFDELWNLLSPYQRTMTSKSFSNLGHEGVLQFNGVSYLVDSHAPAKTLYFLNPDYLKFYVHKDEDMFVQEFKQLEDKNAIKRRVLLMGNLLCTNRRFQGALTDIKVA